MLGCSRSRRMPASRRKRCSWASLLPAAGMIVLRATGRRGRGRREGAVLRGAAGGGFGEGHLQDGLAGPDLIAVVQVGALDAPAVDVGAVAAAHVHQAALRRVDFDEEMNPRKVPVLAGQ